MESRAMSDLSVLIMTLHHCDISKSPLSGPQVYHLLHLHEEFVPYLWWCFSCPFEALTLCTWQRRGNVQVCTKSAWVWRNWGNAAANSLLYFYFPLFCDILVALLAPAECEADSRFYSVTCCSHSVCLDTENCLETPNSLRV